MYVRQHETPASDELCSAELGSQSQGIGDIGAAEVRVSETGRGDVLALCEARSIVGRRIRPREVSVCQRESFVRSST